MGIYQLTNNIYRIKDLNKFDDSGFSYIEKRSILIPIDKLTLHAVLGYQHNKYLGVTSKEPLVTQFNINHLLKTILLSYGDVYKTISNKLISIEDINLFMKCPRVMSFLFPEYDKEFGKDIAKSINNSCIDILKNCMDNLVTFHFAKLKINILHQILLKAYPNVCYQKIQEYQCVKDANKNLKNPNHNFDWSSFSLIRTSI